MTEGHTEPPAHVWALLGLMVTLWSVNFVVAKIALRDFPPLMAGALRFTFAGGMIWPLYWWRKRGDRPGRRDRAGMARLVGIGVLGVGLNQLFFLLGLERTSVGHAALVIATTPVLVLLMSAFAGHERIAAKKVAGLAVAISGVAYLQMSPGKSTAASVLGDVFIFLASLTFSLFTVFGKGVVRRYDSLTVNTFAYVGSGIVLSPLTLWYASGFHFSQVSWAGWLAMLYMALFPSLLCYMIYYYALGFIPATRISMLSYSQPVLATVFAILLLGEHLTQTLVVGGLLVLIGVVLAERA